MPRPAAGSRPSSRRTADAGRAGRLAARTAAPRARGLLAWLRAAARAERRAGPQVTAVFSTDGHPVARIVPGVGHGAAVAGARTGPAVRGELSRRHADRSYQRVATWRGSTR